MLYMLGYLAIILGAAFLAVWAIRKHDDWVETRRWGDD